MMKQLVNPLICSYSFNT